MRPDGAKSCAINSGQSLEAGAADLKTAGIHVSTSRKADDGLMHAQMCGIPAGSTNAYEIDQADLGKAETLGFKKLTH